MARALLWSRAASSSSAALRWMTWIRPTQRPAATSTRCGDQSAMHGAQSGCALEPQHAQSGAR